MASTGQGWDSNPGRWPDVHARNHQVMCQAGPRQVDMWTNSLFGPFQSDICNYLFNTDLEKTVSSVFGASLGKRMFHNSEEESPAVDYIYSL